MGGSLDGGDWVYVNSFFYRAQFRPVGQLVQDIVTYEAADSLRKWIDPRYWKRGSRRLRALAARAMLKMRRPKRSLECDSTLELRVDRHPQPVRRRRHPSHYVMRLA